VQTIKAGIMEVADIFVVNKADRDMAETLYRNLRILVHERAVDGHETPVVKTIATQQKGVEELAAAVAAFFAAQQTMPEKRIHLLTEKTRQLIQAHRMHNISNTMLTEELRKALQEPGFNLYRFARRFF
jgi:LAO/AO transport system kinase